MVRYRELVAKERAVGLRVSTEGDEIQKALATCEGESEKRG